MQKLDLDIRLFLSRHSVEGRLGVDLSSVLFLTYLVAGWGGGAAMAGRVVRPEKIKERA